MPLLPMLILALMVICFGLSGPAAARSVFPVYGAQGDAGATDECPAGSYFTGVVGNTGNWIDQITVVCGEQRPDGSIGGGRSLPSRGGSGGGFKSVLCGKDEVVRQIRVNRTPNYQIAFIQLRCLNVKTAATKERSFGGPRAVGDGTTQTCPAGELGSGLVIRYGKHVNGIGLICGDYREAALPPPKFVTVEKPVDVYRQPTGKEADKTGLILHENTANVTLLERRAPWFRLQWPAGSGWVYSGPGYVSLRLP